MVMRCARVSSCGGDDGIRTHDPLLAGQVLSQLSYTPKGFGIKKPLRFREAALDVGLDLSSRTVSGEVLSTLQSLTSVFGMGTGGPSAFERPTLFSSHRSLKIEQQFFSTGIRSSNTVKCRLTFTTFSIERR